MGDVVDLEEYKKRIEEDITGEIDNLSAEDRAAINHIVDDILARHVRKINDIDCSFRLTIDIEQGKLIRDKVNGLRSDLNTVIIGLALELIRVTVELYMARKTRM